MKFALTHFLLYLVLAVNVFARGTSASVTNNAVQFIENKGQITDQHGAVRRDIDVKIEANGVVLFVGNGELHYQWVKSGESEVVSRESGASGPTHTPPAIAGQALPRGEEKTEVEIYRMDVKLVGANKNAEVIFEEPTGYYENYYLPHSPDGVTAKGYGRVIYKDIYPNIDLVLYSPNPTFPQGEGDGIENNMDNKVSPLGGDLEGAYSRGIKYDFIVHPDGNPADIKLRYEGATEVKLIGGALVATTPYGTITEAAPYSYMAENGAAVSSAYRLEGNVLNFDVQQQDGTLVIDPTLKWATYYGGSSYEQLEKLSVDGAANVYLSGWTESATNIATSGAFHSTAINDWNMYIVKFDPGGSRQWGTYFADTGYNSMGSGSVSADRHGNVYLTGGTRTITGIATSGGYQTSNQGAGDGFMIKFNTAGQRIWGTYFGGAGTDVLGHVCITSQDELIVAGASSSSSGIATPGTYKQNYHVNNGYCLLKFDSSGQRIWGTYTNFAGKTATDVYGNIYAAGGTQLDTGIATTGAHQTTRGSTGNLSDGYLIKFDSTGNRVWGTYYGGSIQETIGDVIVTSPTEIYVSGGGVSGNNIATAGSFNPTQTNSAGFLAKFNHNGVRQWGTYYNGSSVGLSATAMPNGDIIVSTITQTAGLATAGAHKTTISGTYDGFWARFTPGGQRIYATYYGGTGNEYILSSNIRGSTICFAGKYLYLCGTTNNSPGLVTSGAHQTVHGGINDAYVVQFEMDDTLVSIAPHFNTVHACTSDSLYVPIEVTRNFGSSNNYIVQLSNSSGSFASPTTLATVANNTADTIACYLPASIPAGTGYKVRVLATAPADTSQPSQADIAIYSYPANFTSGSNSPLCSGDTLKLNSGSTTTGVTYSWAGPGSFISADDDTIIANTTVAHSGNYYITVNNNGCMVKDTVSVVVYQTPENVTATNNGGLCTGDTLLLTSSSTTSGVSYAWTGPNNYNTQNVTRPNVQIGDAGTYTVTVTLGSCSDTATTTVVVNQGASVNIAPLTPISICAGDTAQFAAFPNNAGTNPQLQWLKNGVAVAGATGTLYKTSTLVNGDVISVLLTPNTSCPGTKESNKITMMVQPVLTPTVSMTADKMPPWNGGLTVTFTASPTHGGANPEYQWKRNGKDITGATSATWGVIVNALNANEDICVVLKSSYECAVPDTALSNCITTAFTGVGEATNNGFKIYPNPTSTILHVEGVEAGSTIELMDILGRKCSITQWLNGSIDVSGLVPGVYVVRVNGVVAGRVVKE